VSHVRIERDLAYATRGDSTLSFDLHLPAEVAGPLPLALYLHGGGWARGARDDRIADRVPPVAASGLAVASIDYRLSGEAAWPAQLEDVRAALAAIPRIVADRGVPLSGRLGLWGASAGGHLALMAALTAAEEGALAPDAVVAWFATTDLALASRAPASPGARMPSFLPPGAPIPPFERMLLGLRDDEDGAAALRAASPLGHVGPGVAPVLLVHGDEDGMVPASHSAMLHAALRDAGSPVTTLLLHGATHEDPEFDTPAVLGATAAHLRGEA